jgi:putative lipoprotein
MKGILVSASLGVLALGLSALSSADTLKGEVYYLPRIALPATAKVTVKLVDASKADAPSEVIASKEFSTEGKQVPIPFELDYEPSRLKATGRYQVQAQIWDGNQLRFTTTTAIPFAGGSAVVRVPVEPVAQPYKDATASVTFFVTELEGAKLANYPGTRRVSLNLNSETMSYGGFAGVNTYGGSFKRDGFKIKFGPARATLMAGDEGSMKIERSLFKVLGEATTAKQFGKVLVLYRGNEIIFKGSTDLKD